MLIDRIEPGVLIHTDTEPDGVCSRTRLRSSISKPMEAVSMIHSCSCGLCRKPAFYLPSDLYIE